MNKPAAAKPENKPQTAAEIKDEENQAVAIFARRLESASSKKSCPDYVPAQTNPVTCN